MDSRGLIVGGGKYYFLPLYLHQSCVQCIEMHGNLPSFPFLLWCLKTGTTGYVILNSFPAVLYGCETSSLHSEALHIHVTALQNGVPRTVQNRWKFMFLFSWTTNLYFRSSVYTLYILHECTNIYLFCSDVVNYFLSTQYCILLISAFMLLCCIKIVDIMLNP